MKKSHLRVWVTGVILATFPITHLPARGLPEDWGWTPVWPREVFTQQPSFVHSDGERVFFVTPDFALASEDGLAWETVPLAPLLETDYPEQRNFILKIETRLNQDRTEFLLNEPPQLLASRPINDFSDSGISLDYVNGSNYRIGNFTIRTVWFDDAWWGVFADKLLRSDNDGTSWQLIDSGFPYLSFRKKQILSDGEHCYLVTQYQQNLGSLNQEPPFLYQVSPDGNLTPQGEISYDRAYPIFSNYFFHKGGLFVRHPPKTELVFGEIVESGAPPTDFTVGEDPSMLDENTLLLLRDTEVIVVKDPLNRYSLPVAVPFSGPKPLAMESIPGVALIIAEGRKGYRSLDGYHWEEVGQLDEGTFNTVNNQFVLYTDSYLARSNDGVHWTREAPPANSDDLQNYNSSQGAYAAGINLEMELEVNTLGYTPRPIFEMNSVDARFTNIHGRSWKVNLVDYTLDFNRYGWAPRGGLDLAYGNGLIVGGDEMILDDSLSGPTALQDLFYRTRFWKDRFLGIRTDKKYYFLDEPIPYFTPQAYYAVDTVYLSDPVPSYPFSGGFLRENSWRGSDWFGWVHTAHYPWVYQYPAGWIYVLGPDETNCWMWDTTEGWFWSSRYHWPEIWDKEKGWRQHANIEEWVW